MLRSPGQPLDTETRAFMEPRFGYEFSHLPVQSVRPFPVLARLSIVEPYDTTETEAKRMTQKVIGRPTNNNDPTYDFSKVQIYAR